MDFAFTEEAEAVRDLAEQVFAGSMSVERVKEVEASDDRIDRELWKELASTVSQSSDWHCGHIGPGGWRSAPQDEHFWITSRWSFAASNQKELSRLTAGRGRFGFGSAFSRGLNLRIRNVIEPTSSPDWSRNSVRVLTK